MATRIGKKPNKRLLISHVDLDGAGSVVLAEYLADKQPDLAYNEIMMVNYGFYEEEDRWNKILSFDTVHIADISVPKEQYEQLLDNCNEVLLFDHHESSEELKVFDTVFHDKERCGTKIYFEEYFKKWFPRVPSILSYFVTLVNTYDLWKENTDLWQEGVNLNRSMFGMCDWGEKDSRVALGAFFAFYRVKLTRLNEWRWLRKEQEIIKRAEWKEQKSYEEAINTISIRKDYRGKVFAVSSIGSKISLVCSRILNENPEIDYMIVVNSFNMEEGRISIRSKKEDFNCTELFPFNGHVAAAGGELRMETNKDLLQDEWLCLVYKDELEEDYDPKDPNLRIFETCQEVLNTKVEELKLGISV